jgi:RNA polymerase sigma-70 factor (ECF subfamily)
MGDLYTSLRPLLFSIAYRMIGSVGDAEDLVQEAFLRFHRAGGEAAIGSPKAFLTTATTRLAIDHLRSARVQREQYIGEWLPEPLVESDAARHAETADSLSLAFLVVLETLSPVERAVFLLRDVFGYEYEAIAGIVGKSEANTRQLAARARRHVDEGRPRFDASLEERNELAERFFAACESGDTRALVELLAADVVVHGDGGGKAPAIPQPVYGADRVARMLIGWFAIGRDLGASLERLEVNGQPGALYRTAEGEVAGVVTVDVLGGQVQAVRSIVNPDKLHHLGPVADLRATFKQRRER